MTHTPGPWTVIEKMESPPVAWVRIGPEGSRYVLNGLSHEDADLIAAAPEMLDWLKHHTSHMRACAIGPGVGPGGPRDRCTCGLDALIAKAEGRDAK